MLGNPAAAPRADLWFDWLTRIRHGGDPAYARKLERVLADIRDRVLEHARLEPGAHIVDVGCGDGLVAFGALEREPTVRLTLVDVSPALIAHTREIAVGRGFADRCRFLVAGADALETLATGCADIVTVRAVLAYLADKPAAVREWLRILRPGGRISIVDPIFADRAFALAGLAKQLPALEAGRAARFIEFLHRCGAAHLPDTPAGIAADPLTNYNERDIVRMFEHAGFSDIHLRLHIDSVPALPVAWDTYLATSPRAGAPTVAEILATAFSAAERVEFEQLFRPRVESGGAIERNVNAYVFAAKGATVPPAR